MPEATDGRRSADKIRPHHLERKAILYVRQSSAPSGAAVTPRRLGTGGAMSKFGIAIIAVVLVTALSSAAPAKGRGHFGLGPLGSVKFAFTE